MTIRDWQIQNMYEAESARLWELQNQEPAFDVKGASKELEEALKLLYKVEDLISSAANIAADNPEEDKIMSLLYELDKFDSSINMVIDDLGVRKKC